MLSRLIATGASLAAMPGPDVKVTVQKRSGSRSSIPKSSPSLSSRKSSEAISGLSPDDDHFLNDLEYANFLFFWEQMNPATGLVKDRANVRVKDRSVLASIAATGFGLTALCIGDSRGFVPHTQIRDRAAAALRSLANWETNHRGFLFHWVNIDTGERILNSEISSVDTAILLCGVLTCRAHFDDEEITRFSNKIFGRVEWTWLSEDVSLLPHGWTPEGGFLPAHWDFYSELMMVYLLGLGSAEYPLPAETWDVWKRNVFEYDGMRYIGSFAPLFIHQYSQAWFDFRGVRDKYANYFENSVIATKAHKRFCLALAKRFPDYGEDLWGITASDSQNGGYQVWGGPPLTGAIDGTIAPSAAAGSLPFLPAETMAVLRNIRNHYGAAWSRYGFVNAFNPLKNWYDSDVIGIDTGITMLMAENLRTGFVWKTFMKNPQAQRGMERAGFKATA